MTPAKNTRFKQLYLLLIICLASIWTMTPAPSFAAEPIRLEVTIEPENQLLTGVAVIPAALTATAPLKLSLNPAATSLEVDSAIRVNIGATGGALSIPQGSGETKIRWVCRFADAIPSTPTHHEDPSYGVRATISPVGTFLGSGSDWHPRPAGRTADYLLTVTGPEGYRLVSEGVLAGEETAGGRSTLTWRTERPEPGLTLAGGPLQLSRAELNGIQLLTFLSPANQPLAGTYLAATADYLKLYTRLFGPYPFGKFAVVENFLPTGYGFPGWTLLGASVVRLPFIVKTSLGHEIAHSWWGNGVDVDPRYGNWAEALTTYVADHYYKEQESAQEARDYRLKTLRDYAALVDEENRFPLAGFRSRNDRASQAIGYGKGMMVFHMLRKAIGDDAFWTALRIFADQWMGKNASWNELRSAFEKASGLNLKEFLNQWLLRDDAPGVALERVAVSRQPGGWQVNGLVSQAEPPYQFNLELKIECEQGEKETLNVAVNASEQPFSLTCANRPVRLVGDPQVDLFRQLSPGELPPTVNGLRNPDNLLAATPGPAATKFLKPLLAAFRQEKVEFVDASEWSAQKYPGRDLLVTRETATSCIEQPAMGVGLREGVLKLPDGGFDLSDHTVFLALPHPADRKHLCFALLSPPGAPTERVSQKIPHYGKYGYLVFSGEANVAKGYWPPADSPLVVDLPVR